jgi:hypothetical protein
LPPPLVAGSRCRDEVRTCSHKAELGAFDGGADEITPLRPGAIVIPHLGRAQRILQQEPGVAGTLADAAVGDGVLPQGDAFALIVPLMPGGAMTLPMSRRTCSQSWVCQFQTTAPGICPWSWAEVSTSTSIWRSPGSCRCWASHSLLTSISVRNRPRPFPPIRVGPPAVQVPSYTTQDCASQTSCHARLCRYHVASHRHLACPGARRPL